MHGVVVADKYVTPQRLIPGKRLRWRKGFESLVQTIVVVVVVVVSVLFTGMISIAAVTINPKLIVVVVIVILVFYAIPCIARLLPINAVNIEFVGLLLELSSARGWLIGIISPGRVGLVATGTLRLGLLGQR